MKLARAIPLGSIIIIAVLGFGVYVNSLSGSFVWDDNSLISDNSAIKSWSGIPGIFSKANISTYTGKTFHIYRPLQILTYMADYSVWGLKPVGYHITNILLHILTAISLYWLISLITSDKFIAFTGGVLFVIHPVHTEAVSYVSGRADPLSALFALLCFIFYTKYTGKKSAVFYALILLTYIFAILSRENIIILPALLLAYNYSLRKKVDIKIIAPLILVALSYAWLRLTLLKHLLPKFNETYNTTLIQRLPGFFAAITDYIKLLIFPVDLHMEYGNKIFSFLAPQVLIGISLAVVLIFIAFKARKSKPVMTFAVLWFLIALIPVSNLYPIGAYMAEHWLYLPSVGFFLIISICLSSFWTAKYLKIIIAVILLMAVGAYSAVTIEQNQYWQDPVIFYERTVKFAPESARANNDMAVAYEKAGMHSEAEGVYEQMLKQYPGNPDVYVNLAAIQIIKGNAEEAIVLCEKALEIEPTNATAHNNLAVAYYTLARYDLAIEQCDLAVKYGYKVKPELIRLLRPYREEMGEANEY